LVAAVPVCFAYFYADYLGEYRVRSAYWFENNIRGALERTIDEASRREVAPPILISSGINQFIEWDWKFYLAKHDRQDLEAQTRYFDPKTLTADAVPAGAVV